MPAHGSLDLLALHRCEVAVSVHPASAGAGVDADRISGQPLGQRRCERTNRVVVLAEDDAAVFELRPPVVLMLGEEVRDGAGLPALGLNRKGGTPTRSLCWRLKCCLCALGSHAASGSSGTGPRARLLRRFLGLKGTQMSETKQKSGSRNAQSPRRQWSDA